MPWLLLGEPALVIPRWGLLVRRLLFATAASYAAGVALRSRFVVTEERAATALAALQVRRLLPDGLR